MRTEEEVIEEEVIKPDEDVQTLPDNNETIDRHELELSLLKEQLDSLMSNISEVDLPLGVIVAYSGRVEDIPLKWALCDGTNGTLDLRDKFIMGSAMDELEAEGGSADAIVVEHDHTVGEHTHPINDHSHSLEAHTHPAGSHSHTVTLDEDTHSHMSEGGHGLVTAASIGSAELYLSPGSIPFTVLTGSGLEIRRTDTYKHKHDVTVGSGYGDTGENTSGSTSTDGPGNTELGGTSDTGSTGEDGTGKNLPPYMKLAYIQRI